MSNYNVQLTALLLLACVMTFAQIPGTLSYQGILVDNTGAPVADGNHSVTFSFYSVASGGTEVFSRGPFTVVTYKGMFTFVIGTGTPSGNTVLPTLATDPNYIGAFQYYVEVLADGVTLAPRVQLSTVPYALHAQNANTMDAAGLTGTVDNLRLDADLQDLADGSLTGSLVGSGISGTNITMGTIADARLEPIVDLTRLNTTGGIHVGGTSDPGIDNLLVDGTATATTFSGGGGSLTGLNATNITLGTVVDARLESTVDLTRLNTTGGIHVGGTSDPGTDNLIVDGQIGLGTTPGFDLHILDNSAITTPLVTIEQDNVAGDAGLKFNTASGRSFIMGIDESDGSSFKINQANGFDGQATFAISGGNSVGIGTSAPVSKLEVESTSTSFIMTLDKQNASGSSLIRFQRSGTDIGYIIESGGVLVFNPFTGSHMAYSEQDLEPGMLVSMTGNDIRMSDQPMGEPLYEVVTNTLENSPFVLGTFLSPLDEPDIIQNLGVTPLSVMAVGNGFMYVSENGEDIQVGDYLISSSISGMAMKDNGKDDVANVIGRASESVDWDDVETDENGNKRKLISVFFEFQQVNHKADRLEIELNDLKNRINHFMNETKTQIEELKSFNQTNQNQYK